LLTKPEIFVLDVFSLSDIEDIRGQKISSIPVQGTVLFIDLYPDANWGHPCLYLLVAHDKISTIKHNFPPNDSIGMR